MNITDQELLKFVADGATVTALREIYEQGRCHERFDQESRELGAAEKEWVSSVMAHCRIDPSGDGWLLRFGADGTNAAILIEDLEFAKGGLSAIEAMVRRAVELAWTGRPAFADVSGLGFTAGARISESETGMQLVFRSREARRIGEASRAVVLKLDEALARQVSRTIDAIYQPESKTSVQDFADTEYLQDCMIEQGVDPPPWESIPQHPAAVQYALHAVHLLPRLMSDMRDALERLWCLQWTGHSFKLNADGRVIEHEFECPFCGVPQPGPHASVGRLGPQGSNWCWYSHWYSRRPTDPALRYRGCKVTDGVGE